LKLIRKIRDREKKLKLEVDRNKKTRRKKDKYNGCSYLYVWKKVTPSVPLIDLQNCVIILYDLHDKWHRSDHG
jgi:hypothetical protein